MKNYLTKKILMTLMIGGGILASTSLPPLPAHAKKYYATFITDGGPLHDDSNNQSVYDGFLMAKTNYDININYLQSKNAKDYLPNLGTVADDDADIIFGIGTKIANDVVKSAKMHPSNSFVLLGVDTSQITLPNLTGVTYAVEQAGYLAGILAGNMTSKYYKSSSKLNSQKIVGAILGAKTPTEEPYVAGYIAGVRAVDPTITVLISTINTFTKESVAEKYTDQMINQGADIILTVAGKANLGAIKSAQKHHTLIIGTNKNHQMRAPLTVITAVEKDIKNSVYNIIRDNIVGHTLPNYIRVGIQENGVRLSQFHQFTNIIPKDVKNNMYQAKKQILQRNLDIPITIDQAFQQ